MSDTKEQGDSGNACEDDVDNGVVEGSQGLERPVPVNEAELSVEAVQKILSQEREHFKRTMKSLLVGVIEISDGLNRLLAAEPPVDLPEKARQWANRFSLVGKRVRMLLSGYATQYNSLGLKANTELHEVVDIVEDPAKEDDTIVAVEAEGYQWGKGEILRRAKVIAVDNRSTERSQ